MNRHTIPLGRVLGIRIGLDYSWFLIFALLTWTLAVGYYPAEFKNWPRVQYWLMGAVTSVMLFVSVLLHELGHSLVALRFKIPVRSITLFVFGGVAQIAAEPPSAVSELLIAVAGPAVSFSLAAFFGLLEPLFSDVSSLSALAKYLAFMNGSLAVFNLIPGFPLDGGRIFRAIVWAVNRNFRRATLVAASVGRFIAFIFIALGVWQIFSGKVANGLWIAFIGWFLESAAMAQVQQQMAQGALAGRKVFEAMRRDYAFVPTDATLQQLVDDYVLGHGRCCFVVQQGQDVKGLLTVHQLKAVPRTDWPTTQAFEVMTPIGQIKSTRPDAELRTALEKMDRDGIDQLPVMADGHMVGMLSREGVVNYLKILEELGLSTS